MTRIPSLLPTGRMPVVLAYHSVREGDTPPPYASPAISIPRRLLRLHLERLAQRHRVVPLDELLKEVAQGRVPDASTVALTFDDGYADNVELALPDLQALGLPATIFVTTSPMLRRAPLWTAELALLIERSSGKDLTIDERRWQAGTPEARREATRALTRAWAVLSPDRVRANLELLAEQVGLPADQARDVVIDASSAKSWVAAGMSLGAHTVHHPNLAYQDDAVVLEELRGSTRDIESVTGETPRVVAYPNCGALPKHHSPEVAREVQRSGFEAAFTSDQGPVSFDDNRFTLPRLSVSPLYWDVDVLDAGIVRARFTAARRVPA